MALNVGHPEHSPDAKSMITSDGARGRQRRRIRIPRPPGEREVLAAVEAARGGEREALHVLYVRYANQVYRYTDSVVNNAEDAADLTQSLFARLPKVLERYDATRGPFSAWIMRVAHNAAIDHVRARRTVSSADVVPLDAVDREMTRGRIADLQEAMAVLAPDERQVILLRFLVGLTPGEVATRMGRTEQAIHSLQHRARRSLRAELLRMDAGPRALAK